MALDKSDAVIAPYTKASLGNIRNIDDVRVYLDRELSKIENILNPLSQMAIFSMTAAPRAPLRGMIKYARSPWNPLGTGDGWVRYNGTSWVSL